MKLRKASPSVIEYHALKGTFGKVTYFVTKTDLRDVAENLSLAPKEALDFGERIQRLVNDRRVEKEILPYLEKNELRFFNSLVCTLLPDTNATTGFWDFEEYEDDAGNPLNGLGKLKIAKKVSRVVLDGQHRFRALQQLWENHKDSDDTDILDIEVSIIFIVAGNLGRFGRIGKQLRAKTIETARNLFAVLNKTARPVDKTTLLLIDDSDICNVMTRQLVEEQLVDEMFIKWVGGENLNPKDPYFTTLHAVKDAVRFFLRDHSDELELDYGIEEDRDTAIEQLFYGKTVGDLNVREAVPLILNGLGCFLDWRKMLKKEAVVMARQPDATALNVKQRKAVERLRNSGLAYTVAGQKCLIRAIIEVVADQVSADLDFLKKVIKRANALVNAGLFARANRKDSPFLSLLHDERGRMTWAERPIDCARRILAIALGSNADKASVIRRFAAMTDRDESVLVNYWKKTQKFRKA